jgi:putative NADH-flavin reductase
VNLLVVGGTRGCGREVVLQGSRRGHAITLLARRAVAVPAVPRLTLVEGDARDEAAVAQAMQGQDAVIVCLGTPLTRRPVRLFSDAMAVILRAMATAGVQRLLYVTGLGAGDSRGRGGLVYDRLLVPLFLRTIYSDKDRSEALVMASPTRWTICRPGLLTNGPMLARYRIVTRLGLLRHFRAGAIARADVAHFLLEEVERDEFVHATALVCY